MSIRLSQTAHAQQFLEEASGNLKHFSDFIVNHLNRTAGVMDIRSEIVLQKIKDRDEVLDLVVRK
jgi:hypothetical protein